jgi:hypothetical protein
MSASLAASTGAEPADQAVRDRAQRLVEPLARHAGQVGAVPRAARAASSTGLVRVGAVCRHEASLTSAGAVAGSRLRRGGASRLQVNSCGVVFSHLARDGLRMVSAASTAPGGAE